MDVRILDLDGSVARQHAVVDRAEQIVSLRSWGPRLRLACSWSRYRSFEQELACSLRSHAEEQPWLSFVGSGDFHHVTLALLRRLTQPFNLLVIDNHPDWMRWVPMLHCGTWLSHALALPNLHQVFHVGGDVDFDNYYRWLAPWSALVQRRLVVIPATRRFHRGRWAGIPHAPLRSPRHDVVDRQRIDSLVEPWKRDLMDYPLYVSLDRDVMRAEDADVNWDSGHLHAEEVLTIVEGFQRISRSLIGMDVVGDRSDVCVQGALRRILHWTEHPPLSEETSEKREVNERLNLRLIELVRSKLTKSNLASVI